MSENKKWPGANPFFNRRAYIENFALGVLAFKLGEDCYSDNWNCFKYDYSSYAFRDGFFLDTTDWQRFWGDYLEEMMK